MPSVAELLDGKKVAICAGSGGVGKTTTSAAIAAGLAARGGRVVVLTIDPAKRLADSLGLKELGNEPRQVDRKLLERAGTEVRGELWAMMLDAKATFDELVRKNAPDEDTRDRILENPIYRQLSNALAGSQEYMAMEKLYEIHQEGRYDFLVLDTPPSRNALDFLDAPQRLSRFLDHRLYRILIAPTRGVLKAASAAAQAFVRSVTKVVGGEVFDDAITFFSAFEGMEKGFKERADAVTALLADEGTAFVLVASPRSDTVTEAGFFAEKLAELGLTVRALVVNRMHPRFLVGAASGAAARQRAKTLSGTALGAHYANAADFAEVADAEEAHLADLAAGVAPAPVVRVPMLAADVHDLDGLTVVGGYLFAD